MADDPDWVWYLVHNPEIYKGVCIRWPSSSLSCRRLPIHEVRLPRRRHNDFGQPLRNQTIWGTWTRIPMDPVLRWCLQCTWKRYRRGAHLSRRLPYSIHRQTLLQLYEQHGRVWSLHLWTQGFHGLGNQILRCVWGLGFGYQSDQRIVGY